MTLSVERAFVDTGAWIALAEARDPLHDRARTLWEVAQSSGMRWFTSIPVILETFTFLDRKGSRELALRWKEALEAVPRLQVLEVGTKELERAWPFLQRKEFLRLSLVDATSFILMRKQGLRVAFAFDTHFAQAGFRYLEG